MREKADLRRIAGLAGILRLHAVVLDVEDMKFDFKTGDEIIATCAEIAEHLLVEVARRERHRTSVGEMHVAQNPAGLRRPRQYPKRAGIGDHQHVGRALHFRNAEAATGGEHRKHRLVRRVLGEHGRGDRAAAFETAQCLAGDQRLAAQDAVLIRKRQPDHFELVLFDHAAQPDGCFLLLRGPQTVTFNETQRTLPRLF